MSIEKTAFGTLPDGAQASNYTLRSGSFMASFSDYGATWLSFEVPAGAGTGDDLLLGYSNLSGYLASDAYFGATVGRYANRIAKASFCLDGKPYRLAANNGANHLHGGLKGFDKRIWKALPFDQGLSVGLRFELESEDGEEGYPGALHVSATYVLDVQGSIDITYVARCEAPTIIGLTQHAYFNLAGKGQGDILDHELCLKASRYLPVDGDLIPTGEVADVAGGPFDFSALKSIGRDIERAGDYDHCFAIDRRPGDPCAFVECAELRHPKSGRRLAVSTTMPGIQLYSGNYLEGIKGKNGRIYKKYSGLCLETEAFPDSPNQPEFPGCVLRPGQVWEHRTRYSFLI